MVMAPPARDASIDALRVIGVAAGLTMHAAIPYTTAEIPELVWSVRDPASAPIADAIFWWGRAAQVQLFFAIAGIVAVRVFAARGAAAFLRGRAARLGVPLAAAVVFVLPVVAAIWAAGWIVSGRASWSEVWSWRFADAGLQRNRIGPAHLWFLQDLLIISLVAALAWHRRLQPILVRLVHLPAVPVALAAIGAALVWARPEAMLSVPNSFVPDPFRIACGLTFVAGGAWLAAGERRIRRATAAALIVCGGLAGALLSWLGDLGATRPLVSAALFCASGWCTVLGCAGSTNRAPVAASSAWSHVADRSYAFYIAHVPVVGAIHLLLFGRVPALAGMAIALVAGGLASWLLVSLWRRFEATLASGRLGNVPLSASAAAAAALALGIGLRLLHYVRNPDVWHDEAALLVNVIERDYGALLGPLTYHEAAPPLFLWLERWIALGAGDSTWLLRLPALVASIAALLALWPLGRAAGIGMAPAAIFLMATSTELLGHSVEAKPYALDVLIATLAAWFFLASARWPISARMGAAAAAAPAIIWTSYPGIFVVGGLVAALAVDNLRTRNVRAVWPMAALGLVCLGSFALLVLGPVQAQRSETILANWAWAFPVGLDPWHLALWLGRALVGLADYCFRPLGGLLVVPVAVGAAACWRRGDRTLVVLLAGPIVLAAAAGAAGQYPFSGTRVMIFALPALSLLAAEGLSRLAAHAAALPHVAHATVLATAMLPPSVLAARDLVTPWTRPETAAAADIVLAARRPSELVASGNWESRYLFRRLGQRFVPLDERSLPTGAHRIWCVVHGPSPAARRAKLAAAVRGDYRIATTIDLVGVSVIELGAVD